MNKKSLRKEMIERRNGLTREDNMNLSNQVIDKLMDTEEYKSAENIFVFVSTESEVFTHNFIKNSIRSGKNIYVPYVDSVEKVMYATELKSFDDLEMGFYNILAVPKSKIKIVNPSKLDLIVVPGLIFGKNFYRIGYGGGYYDKYLSQNDIKASKVGICFDFQIVEEVDHKPYDMPVDKIITDKVII